ncbi:MAG: heme biosynthesis HemY N-terminal domain-containing protein [Pseudomonadota bacterium]
MLWSLAKVLVFVAIAIALTFGAGYILETPGEIRLAFAGREVTLQPIGFLLICLLAFFAFWVLLKLAGLIVATLRFLTGERNALSRYFDRNRERKGYDALSEGLMALASGDGRKAQVKAARAEMLLDKPDLTRLLNAQAAELNGNTSKATRYYKEMLTDDRTRFVGVKGLLAQKLEQGDTETALQLAQKAFAMRPKQDDVADTLFQLQTGEADWSGAKTTLQAKVRHGQLPRDVGKRREAVLALANAKLAEAEGNTAGARDNAYRANKLVPGLVPAAVMAARLHDDAEEGRAAVNGLKTAWAQSPHPDLAAAFAKLAPDESPAERRKRFEALLRKNPTHPESKMTAAELALADEDFPGARKALGDLAETRPTTRVYALMAAIEKGEGAADNVVRGWLAKALSASRDETWICSNCKTTHVGWTPICSACDAFDTLEWTTPPSTPDSSGTTAAMLPLIVGSLEDHSDQTAEAMSDAGGDGGNDTPEAEVRIETVEPANDPSKAPDTSAEESPKAGAA